MFDANLYREDNDASDNDQEGEDDDLDSQEEEDMKKGIQKA